MAHGRAVARLTIVTAGALALGAGAVGAAQVPKGRSAAANALRITSRPFGSYNGQPVRLYTLSNGHMRVRITNFGGIIQSIYVPGRSGRMADVALGFRNLAGYVNNDKTNQPSGGSGTTYFGATIGRYANRIAGGKFTLNGVTYKLPVNNGPNTLHGGPTPGTSRCGGPPHPWGPTAPRSRSATPARTCRTASREPWWPT